MQKNINKWLNNNIELHFSMKHFNMTQWRVLCPHNHVLKTRNIQPATSANCRVRELSSPLLDQSVSWHIRELSSYLVNEGEVIPLCHFLDTSSKILVSLY